MGKIRPGNIQQTDRGSRLISKAASGHDKQPQGHSMHDSAPVSVKKGGYHRADHHCTLIDQHKK